MEIAEKKFLRLEVEGQDRSEVKKFCVRDTTVLY